VNKNIVKIREFLLQNKKELETKLDSMKKEVFSDGQVQDPGDQALLTTMESLRTSMQDSDVAQYKRIIHALQKLDDGSYGVCIDCGNDISEKRLLSFPDADRCLACQEEFEELQQPLA
jgi:DnaK suppressor protein